MGSRSPSISAGLDSSTFISQPSSSGDLFTCREDRPKLLQQRCHRHDSRPFASQGGGRGFSGDVTKPCPKTACYAQLHSENNSTAFDLFLRCSTHWRIQGFLCKIPQAQWGFVTNAGARLRAGQPRPAPLLCRRAPLQRCGIASAADGAEGFASGRSSRTVVPTLENNAKQREESIATGYHSPCRDSRQIGRAHV